jgi:YesN/AraC family two-component response regulator
MAIAPIDLQTLFTQVDKVGRSVSAQKEGQALQQSIQGVEIQRKTEEHIKEVNEAQNMGDGLEKINDKNSGQKQHRQGSRKEEQEQNENEQEEAKASVLRHPTLGRKIDIVL